MHNYELRLLSMNDGNEATIEGQGRLQLRKTTITSWDATASAPARALRKGAGSFPGRTAVTKTDSTGQTPLLRKREKTLVIAEKHVSRVSPWHKYKLMTTRHRCSIKVRKRPLFGRVTDVSVDDTWYRPDANEPTYTVVLKLVRKVTSGRNSPRSEERGEPPAGQRHEGR